MAKAAKDHARARIATLEDELKQRDARVKELRADLDRADALISELREHAEDNSALIESWVEAFVMVRTDDGKLSYAPWIEDYDRLHDEHRALIRKWNAAVSDFNATIAPPSVGRPPAASQAQVAG